MKLGQLFGSRGTASVALTAAVIAVVVAFNAVIYALTVLLGLYLYSPESEDLSISGSTDALFAEAIEKNKEVTLTFCMPEKDIREHATGSFVYKTATALRDRYGDFIRLRFVNLYTHRDDNGERVDLEGYKVDLRGEETSLRTNTVIFSSGENYRVLTDDYSGAGFADFFVLDGEGSAYAYVGEEIIASMICWVLQDYHGTAYITQNHGETADITFSTVLACAGYYVDVINLRTQKQVPEDAELLIISNPVTDFERGADRSITAEIEVLNDYLSGGGSLYVALDPYARRLPNLEGLLAEWGITVDGATRDGSYYRHIVKESDNAITLDGLTFSASLSESEGADAVLGGLRAGGLNVKLREAASLTLDSACGAVALLTTSRSAATMSGDTVASSEGGFTVAAYSLRANDNGTTSSVFVVPSVYFTSTDALVNDGYCNKDLVYSLLSSVANATCTPYGCRSVVYDLQALEGLTMGAARVYAAILLSIPAALAVFGTVIIVRRKHR